MKTRNEFNFDALTPPFDSTPAKGRHFQPFLSSFVHAPNWIEPWIGATRRNGVMLLLPFDRADESESLVKL